MKLLRIAKWSMIVVAGVIVAAVAIVLSTDFGAYKDDAEKAVQDATGRKLAIDGPVKLAFLPLPSLVAEKVRFANAPWGSRPDMATADRVELKVALLPLVSGKVVVKHLLLDKPDILVETDPSGRGNWQMKGAEPASPSGSGGFALPVLDDVTINDAHLTYRDGRTKTSETITLKSVRIKGAGAGAPLDISLHGGVNEKDFALAGRLTHGAAETWTLADVQGSYGKTRINGTVSVDPTAAPPSLIAKLDSPEIDLASFAGSAPGNPPAGPDADRVFPEAALPLDMLRVVNADVSLTAKSVVSGKLVLTDAAIGMKLKDGKLAVRPIAAALAGGAIDGTATLDSAGAVSVQLMAKDVDTDQLLTSLGTPDALAGKASFNVKLSGHGRAVRQLLASLDGMFGVVIGEGKIGSGYVDLLGADLIQTLLPGGKDANTTHLNCIAAPFLVEKGIATTDAILFDTDRMTVRGGGTVSLRDETLDLLLKPEPKDAALISLATPIRVGGTLANPSAYPDAAGVVKGVAGALAGAALGPVGLLLPLLSAGSGDQNPCVAALLKREGKAPTPATQDKGSGGVFDNLGTGIEKGIRSLFGK